jgi:hypothetical protein
MLKSYLTKKTYFDIAKTTPPCKAIFIRIFPLQKKKD